MPKPKILYSAGDHKGSFFQMKRILENIDHNKYDVKVCAYDRRTKDHQLLVSSDSLLDFRSFKPYTECPKTFIYEQAKNIIKQFNPDLIISDYDFFISSIANELNIKYWIVSPLLLYLALDLVTKKKLFQAKEFANLFNFRGQEWAKRNNIIENSERNIIYSIFSDFPNFKLPRNNEYTYVRPYYIKANEIKSSNDFNFLYHCLDTKKSILNNLKDFNTNIFTSNVNEIYNNVTIHDYRNIDKYKNILGSINFFISEGETSLLADAFYNNKFSIINKDTTDLESFINSVLFEHFDIGLSYTHDNNFDLSIKKFKGLQNSCINYLHNEIEEYFDQ